MVIHTGRNAVSKAPAVVPQYNTNTNASASASASTSTSSSVASTSTGALAPAALLASDQVALDLARKNGDIEEASKIAKRMLRYTSYRATTSTSAGYLSYYVARELALVAAKGNYIDAFLMFVEYGERQAVRERVCALADACAKAGRISEQQAQDLDFDLTAVAEHIDWPHFFTATTKGEYQASWKIYDKPVKVIKSPKRPIKNLLLDLHPRILRDVFTRCGIVSQKEVDRILDGFLIDREGVCNISWAKIKENYGLWWDLTANFLIQKVDQEANSSRSFLCTHDMTGGTDANFINSRPVPAQTIVPEVLRFVGKNVLVHASYSGVDIKPFAALDFKSSGKAFGPNFMGHAYSSSFQTVELAGSKLNVYNMLPLLGLFSSALDLPTSKVQFWYQYLEHVPDVRENFVYGLGSLYSRAEIATCRDYADRALKKVVKDVPGEISIIKVLLKDVWRKSQSHPSKQCVAQADMGETTAAVDEADEEKEEAAYTVLEIQSATFRGIVDRVIKDLEAGKKRKHWAKEVKPSAQQQIPRSYFEPSSASAPAKKARSGPPTPSKSKQVVISSPPPSPEPTKKAKRA